MLSAAGPGALFGSEGSEYALHSGAAKGGVLLLCELGAWPQRGGSRWRQKWCTKSSTRDDRSATLCDVDCSTQATEPSRRQLAVSGGVSCRSACEGRAQNPLVVCGGVSCRSACAGHAGNLLVVHSFLCFQSPLQPCCAECISRVHKHPW